MARDEHNKAAEHHKMLPRPIAPQPNITARATMPRARNMPKCAKQHSQEAHKHTDQAHSKSQQQK